ncbi:hypothetical protein M0R04_04845 [Candidatus Dojkabacteria bacterium]|jgi:hypothetical protein|nr:hypothetical protein [Candidatus Dojkabacteria bacterium]
MSEVVIIGAGKHSLMIERLFENNPDVKFLIVEDELMMYGSEDYERINVILKSLPYYDILSDIEEMSEKEKYQQLTKPCPPWSRSFKGKSKIKKRR